MFNKKTTFILIGSNNKKLSKIEDTLKEKSLNITRTDLLNICISEFLSNINTPEDINTYLIKYNKL